MSYLSRLLAEDERVVLDLRPHAGKALAGPALMLVLVCGLTGFLAGRVPHGDLQAALRGAVAAAGLFVVLALCLRPWLRWRTTRYLLTDRRVLLRAGVLSRTGHDLPLSRVEDVHLTRTLLERVLGCGTLVVASAGERRQVALRDVPRVEEVCRTLYELVEDADVRRTA